MTIVLRPAATINCFPAGTPCEFQVIGTTIVNGNVQADKMTGSIAVQQSTIQKGNIKIVENLIPTGEVLYIFQNSIAAGNLHVFKNKGPAEKYVQFKTVSNGDIQCYENDPTVIGGPNFGRAPNQPPPLMSGRNQYFGTPI